MECLLFANEDDDAEANQVREREDYSRQKLLKRQLDTANKTI